MLAKHYFVQRASQKSQMLYSSQLYHWETMWHICVRFQNSICMWEGAELQMKAVCRLFSFVIPHSPHANTDLKSVCIPVLKSPLCSVAFETRNCFSALSKRRQVVRVEVSFWFYWQYCTVQVQSLNKTIWSLMPQLSYNKCIVDKSKCNLDNVLIERCWLGNTDQLWIEDRFTNLL